jgi:hypothetical protein
MQPVLRLRRLSDSELYALVIRLASLHSEYHKWDVRVTEENMKTFLMTSLDRTGADTMITPREIIRDFVTLLDLLYTNTDKTFADIAGAVQRSTVSANVDDADDNTSAPASAPVSASGGNPKPADARPKITLDDIEF